MPPRGATSAGRFWILAIASHTAWRTIAAKVDPMIRHRSLARLAANALPLGLAFLLGCGDGIVLRPEPTEFTVKVTSGGKPVSGINLGLSPIGEGLPAGVVLRNGSGQGRAIPGDYMYFAALGDAKGPQQTKEAAAVLQTIPRQYHEADPTRLITITNGGALEITLD